MSSLEYCAAVLAATAETLSETVGFHRFSTACFKRLRLLLSIESCYSCQKIDSEHFQKKRLHWPSKKCHC